jgi:hypothetical protein
MAGGGGNVATKEAQTAGLRRGRVPTVRCVVCTWTAEKRRKLVDRVLDGTTQRELEKEFGQSKTAIGRHLRECEAGNIERQRLERHRAIDWTPILDALAEAGDDAALAVKAAAQTKDVAAAIAGIEALTANIEQRIDIADKVRKLEHDQLRECLREIASAFVLLCPTRAPALIAEIIADRPGAINVLERLTDAD